MRTTFRRWPASAWYVQVYFADDEYGVSNVWDHIQVMHVSHTDPIRLTGEPLGDFRSYFPEATQAEYDDLAAAIGEIRMEYKLGDSRPEPSKPKPTKIMPASDDELDLPDMF